MFEHVPSRRPRPGMTLHPRKVRGGIRVPWAGTREPDHALSRQFLDIARQNSSPEDFAEGLEYARKGQAVSVEFSTTAVTASVQGRSDRPYSTSVRFRAISQEVWDTAVRAMAGQAIYTARLLAGEVPEQLDSLFAASGAGLVPAASDVQVACTCGHTAGWCKHVCTVWAITTSRIQDRAFALFELRGRSGDHLLDAVRSSTGQGELAAVSTPVYEAHVPGAPSARGKPLEECLDAFWDAGPELEGIPTPIGPPAVTHPLLRRLGPSPFKEWRFPLLGLLATCYDVIGAANLDREEEEMPAAETSGGPAVEPDGGL
ncbi:MAG: hypothetical protein IPJ41_07360 [Phycisphaerales bacterium]|nr:hypothetical protein [Phycisphaerales bacterium]